jgi:predicted secreted protein
MPQGTAFDIYQAIRRPQHHRRGQRFVVNLSTPGLDLVEDAISDGFAAIGWDESMARLCEILGISHGLRGLLGQGTTSSRRRLASLI